MTSSPGRIKCVVDVPTEFRKSTDDIRSAPEFGQIRHEIWSLLRDEVLVAEQEERRKKLGGRPAARAVRQEVALRG
jgi:NitT/TauT family transport system ATP-binding protein